MKELPKDPKVFNSYMLESVAKHSTGNIVPIPATQAQQLRKIKRSDVPKLAEKWQDVVKAIIRPDSEKQYQDWIIFYEPVSYFENLRDRCTAPTGYSPFFSWVYSVLKSELTARSKETGPFKLRAGDDPVLFGMAGRTIEERDNVLACHISRQQRAELKDITSIPENWMETVSAVLNGQGWILTNNNPAEQLLNIKHQSEPNKVGEAFYSWVIDLLKSNNEV